MFYRFWEGSQSYEENQKLSEEPTTFKVYSLLNLSRIMSMFKFVANNETQSLLNILPWIVKLDVVAFFQFNIWKASIFRMINSYDTDAIKLP